MTTSFIFVDHVGPSTGLLIASINELFPEVFVYNASDGNLLGSDVSLPPWAREPQSHEFRIWFDDFCKVHEIKAVFSYGMTASEIATKTLTDKPIYAILRPSELDFRRTRKKMVDRFKRISEAVSCLIFFNEWEMYKASSIGSLAKHFVWDLTAEALSTTWTLSEDANSGTVVYFDHRKHGNTPSLDELGIYGLDATDVQLQPVNSLFWHSDLVIGRKYKNTLHLRAARTANAVFIDNDADSLAALASMRTSNGGNVLAKDSIETASMAVNSTEFELGSLPRIAALLSAASDVIPSPRTVAPDNRMGKTLTEILMVLEDEKLPWFFEDFSAFDSLNVFFSVAPLENRSNGARPQRIRNMYVAIRNAGPTIHMSFNDEVLFRRSKYIRWALQEGIRIPYFYGENSTSPIQELDGPIAISRLLDDLSHESSTESLYFVRDVHWLDDSLEISSDQAKLIKYGQHELRRMSMSVGGLVAPSYESAVLYSKLAEPYFNLRFIKSELPPGLLPQNAAPASLLPSPSDQPTLVYTGGVSNLYSMDSYLAALSNVLSEKPSSCFVDFIIRESERGTLVSWLAKYSLDSHPDIRITTQSFESYSSRSRDNVGILLLDSNYGKSAFAFKAVSYLERQMPFVVFEDSPNFRYFRNSNVAIPVKSSDPLAITEALRAALRIDTAEIDWTALYKADSWQARWETVKGLAKSKLREKR